MQDQKTQNQKTAMSAAKSLVLYIATIHALVIPVFLVKSDHWVVNPERIATLSSLAAIWLVLLFAVIRLSAKKVLDNENFNRVSELLGIVVIMEALRVLFWVFISINT